MLLLDITLEGETVSDLIRNLDILKNSLIQYGVQKSTKDSISQVKFSKDSVQVTIGEERYDPQSIVRSFKSNFRSGK
jgi:hypothetical protein